MKKIPIIAAGLTFVALLTVLTVNVIKNNSIKTKVAPDATSSAVSTEMVSEETTTIIETLVDVVESTSVGETEESILQFSNNQQTAASVVTVQNSTGATTKAANTTETTKAASSTAAATTKATTTKATTTNATTTKAATTAAPVTTGSSTYEYAYAGFNPTYVTVPSNEKDLELFLVNRDYIISADYTPKLVHSIGGDSNRDNLDYRVAPHFKAMYLAAQKDGITLTPVSGYRSYATQKRNFENKIQTYMNNGNSKVAATQKAATIILPPGTSEHNVGIAMDIISLEQSFENTKAFAWLQANAADYGFILRYPKDKVDVTKIIYEPWHWRYVGVDNAKKIKASGLTLEEYLGKA